MAKVVAKANPKPEPKAKSKATMDKSKIKQAVTFHHDDA